MDQKRRNRLEELIREQIATLIASGEVKDPRVSSFISVTRVEAGRDGSTARVYVSCIGDDDRQIDAAVDGLVSASGYIQSMLARRTRLRLTPVLHFIADRGIREGFEMTEKIKGLMKE
jgi:ribosome-binding factor A